MADPMPDPRSYRGRDVYCITCGYDLRGQPMGGVCPECGTPVWRSPARVEPRASARFDRLLLIYGMVTAIGLLVLFVVGSYTDRRSAEYRTFDRIHMWRTVATLGLVLLGLAWLAASRHARRSTFLVVLIAVNFFSMWACVPSLSRA
jgi:hypothetical protein